MDLHGGTGAARCGALALALLLASAPLAHAGGEVRHGGSRRAGPPPTPSLPPSTTLHPGRAHLAPPGGGGGASPFAGRGSGQPLSSLPTVSRGSVPLGTPVGQAWAGRGPSNPHPAPFAPAPPFGGRSLDVRRANLGTGTSLPGGNRFVGGGHGTLNGGPTPLRLPSPLGGTGSSSAWDTRRFAGGSSSQPTQPTQPLGAFPGWRSRQASQPFGGGASVNDGAALAALRARAAASQPAPSRVVAPGGTGAPAAVHHGGVRSGGAAAAHAGPLPTHQGGVRVEPRRWRSFHRGGREHWTPDWGYAPFSPPVTVVNVFGFPEPCCCPEPVAVPVPVYVEPPYVAPPPVVVAPEPSAWPAPAPAPAPAPDAQARRAEAFRAALEAFQRPAYDEALVAFEALVRADAKDGEAWMAVAHASFALGRYARASEALAQAAALGGFPRGYRFDPAPLYPAAGTFDLLFEALVRRVVAEPRDADARVVLAWLLTSLGERVEAQEQIQQVLLLRPDDATAPALAIALLPAPTKDAGAAAGAEADGPAPVPVPGR